MVPFLDVPHIYTLCGGLEGVACGSGGDCSLAAVAAEKFRRGIMHES